MDNEYYDKFFGEEVTISIYPSHEPIKKSNWMLYTCNSISSIAYISNAILLFIFCNTLCIISYLGAILSFLLGIASFFGGHHKEIMYNELMLDFILLLSFGQDV